MKVMVYFTVSINFKLKLRREVKTVMNDKLPPMTFDRKLIRDLVLGEPIAM